MRKGTELDNRFYELKHDKVSGTGKYKKEGAQDVKIYTTQKESTFAKRFTEGIFQPLSKFCDTRCIPWPADVDEEVIAETVRMKYPSYRVVKNQEGVFDSLRDTQPAHQWQAACMR